MVNIINKDLEYLEKVINLEKKDLYKNYFCWLYPFTNENIRAYYNEIDMKNKKILTVTSSGDQLLNALLKSPSSVECFDSNPLAKYYSELKIAGIKSLTYEEFLLFFYLNKKEYLNYKIYINKIRQYLNKNNIIFWDYLFNKYNVKEIKKSFLFTSDYLILNDLIIVNDYMKEENYYKLKEILLNKEIKYYDLNINELSKIDKKYDIINLSNIINFFDEDNLENELINLNKNIEKISNNNSTIILNYIYGDLYSINKNIVDRYYSNKDYKYITFESSDSVSYPKTLKKLFPKKDKVLIINEK